MRGLRRTAALASAVVLLPGAAAAHAPVPGVGALWNGVLHPFLVPAHLLVLVAAGLAMGQNAPRASRLGLPVFLVLFGGALAVAVPGRSDLVDLLIVALAASILVVLGRAAALPIVFVTAVAAIAVGLDSAPDGATRGDKLVVAIGTLGGAILVVILAGGLAAAFRRPWQRIAVRAVGSWIAAVSVIVLALVLSGPEGLS